MVTPIRRADLDALAIWLCDEHMYHEYSMTAPKTLTESDHKQFEDEQKRNGGYCNRCKNFAGELLSLFHVTPLADDESAVAV